MPSAIEHQSPVLHENYNKLGEALHSDSFNMAQEHSFHRIHCALVRRAKL